MTDALDALTPKEYADDPLPSDWPTGILKLFERNGVTTWHQVSAMERGEILEWNHIGRIRIRKLRRLLLESGRCVENDLGRRVPLWRFLTCPLRFTDIYYKQFHSEQPTEYVPPEPRGGVYFVRSSPFIKIGLAFDVLHRLHALGTDNPHEIVPLGWIPTERKDRCELEASLHLRFAQHRFKREWFHMHADLLDFIRDHAQPWPKRRGT